LLVEDTYFSDGAALDRAALRQRALAYAKSRGFAGAEVVREEEGVLPMPWRGGGLPRPSGSPLLAGYQGGWFHPATGYSFPVAARLAALIGSLDRDHLFAGALDKLAAAVRRQAAFARQLNRLLFRWCAPGERWQILERFYRLPEDLIRRFYALELEAGDMARILIGRPPRGLSLRARLFGGGA
jgi:lycopene beta-cyclase